jgi:uncharacterized membrane protein YidH (DUF202 family)
VPASSADRPEVIRARARTALAWRRTALGQIGVCLVAFKVMDLVGPGAALVGLFAAALLLGYAEQRVRRLPSNQPRPVLSLLTATAAVITCLAAAGVVLAATA